MSTSNLTAAGGAPFANSFHRRRPKAGAESGDIFPQTHMRGTAKRKEGTHAPPKVAPTKDAIGTSALVKISGECLG